MKFLVSDLGVLDLITRRGGQRSWVSKLSTPLGAAPARRYHATVRPG
jgi:hypothetical protein